MKKQGFSLVEILVALIVVSTIGAAMAPVITKKLAKKTISIANELKMTCTKFGPNCGLCYPDKCVSCGLNCTVEQALDIPNCQCRNCADDDMHGVNCLRCDMLNCVECNEIYYVDKGDCLICPIGDKCNGTRKTNCGNGKYTDTEGQIECKDCEAGFKCNSGIKTACEAGTYSEALASSCPTCPKGYKCVGSKNKEQCLGNLYQNETGKNSCKTCLAGSYVTDNREECKLCEAGYKCSGDGTRILCPAGTYQPNTGQTDCLDCPEGNACSGGSNAVYCSAGTYAKDSTTCETCPKGYYCTGGSNKTSCGDGNYLDTTGGSASTSCKTCASKTSNCTACGLEDGTCSACIAGAELEDGECKLKGLQYTCNPTTACSEDTLPSGKKRIKITAGCQFSVTQATTAQIFAVGGGGGGGSSYGGYGGAGGGGYTTTKDVELALEIYAVTIGSGGSGAGSGGYGTGSDGGKTIFGNNLVVANGGKAGKSGRDVCINSDNCWAEYGAGGNGGSGGGGAGSGAGGSNGGNGSNSNSAGGQGQGTTTYFNGEYYAGGGGGGSANGGQGGGGSRWGAGTANTGGGGATSAKGGSGIVIIVSD